MRLALLFVSLSALTIAIVGLVLTTTASNNDALVRLLPYILQSITMASNMNATTSLIQNGTVNVRSPTVIVPYRLYMVDFGQFISYAVEVDPIPAPISILTTPSIRIFDPPIYPILPGPGSFVMYMPESESQKILFNNPPVITNRWYFEYSLQSFPESFRLNFRVLDTAVLVNTNTIQWTQPVRFYFGPVPKFQLINP
jgi:hypothetical protein